MTRYPYVPAVGSVPHPGDTIAEIIYGSGSTQTEWAYQLGVSLKHINQIVCGKAGYSADLALRIEELSGVHARFLMHLQADYELDQARLRRRNLA